MANVTDFFGINIGHSSIKLARIVQEKDKSLKLAGISSTPTTMDFLADRSVLGFERLSAEIMLAYKNSKFKTKNCVLSIPETEVFARLLSLPQVEDKEISETINWALKPMVPVPMENLNISFLEIDKSNAKKEKASWYAVAAPKDRINQYMQMFSNSGLNLLAIETESLAIARLIQHSYKILPSEDVFIMDIGAETTNVILARGGIPLFSQSISTGSNALTKILASDFAIESEKAEEYKIKFGLDLTGEGQKIARSLLPIMDLILGEALRTLRYYEEKIKGPGITKAYLTGGGSALLGIKEYFEKKSSLQTTIADLLANIASPLATDQNQNFRAGISGFNVAIGLALKGFIVN